MVLQGPLTEPQNLPMALPSPPMVPLNPLTVLQSLPTELPSQHMGLQSRRMVGVVQVGINQVVPVGMGMIQVVLVGMGMVR